MTAASSESFLSMNFEYHKEQKYWQITQGTHVKVLCAHESYTKESSRPPSPEIKRTLEHGLELPGRRRAPSASSAHTLGRRHPAMWCIVCCRPDLMHVKHSSGTSRPGDMVTVAELRQALPARHHGQRATARDYTGESWPACGLRRG
jgi:hypothetical protein